MRGYVDDASAQISVAGLDEAEIEGTIGRNGLFGVEDLPLAPGTNRFTLRVSDLAGNATNVTMTVFRSEVRMPKNPVPPDELHRMCTSVTGTISHPGYAPWINGVRADLEGSKWSAAGVPISPGAVLVFQRRAIPLTANGGKGHLPRDDDGLFSD